MSPHRAPFIAKTVYFLAMIYFAVDLFLFHGPLRQHLAPMIETLIKATHSSSVTASIKGKNFSLRAIDQRNVMDSAQSGQPLEFPQSNDSLFLMRYNALDSLLIEHHLDELILSSTGANSVKPDEVENALQAEVTRHETLSNLEAHLADAGLDLPSYRRILEQDLMRARQLESLLEASGSNTVTENEISSWFHSQKDLPPLPARVQLRHYFRASLHQEPTELEAHMQGAYQALIDGTKTFSGLVASSSDDMASKHMGGKLGWVELLPDRLPKGLDAGFFSTADVGKILPPRKSDLGWHIFVIDQREDSRPATLEEMREEIRTHLLTNKRREVIEQILQRIKSDSTYFSDGKILATEAPDL